MSEALLLVHAGSTWFMLGLVWFVQWVHYPLFAAVGHDSFAGYEALHTRRTTWLVMPPMLIELASSGLLLWVVGGPLTWVGLGLLAAIWLSTVCWQVPCHTALQAGFDAQLHRRLVLSNWLRTVLWTVRAGLALGLLVAGDPT